MILLISYPEAKAKARVITSKDQLARTVKTLHKAGTLHIEISKELGPVNRTALEKEFHTTDNLLTSINYILRYIRTSEQVDIGDDIKLIYTGPFKEYDYHMGLLRARGVKHNKVAI